MVILDWKPSLEPVTAVLAFLVLFLGITAFRISKQQNLPPGPRGLPLIGVIHLLPSSFQEKKFYKWSKTYGDIMYFRLFRTPAIVLSTVEAARDMLDKRSAKCSDRPSMVLFSEMSGEGTLIPAIQYGERLRMHRKWIFDGVGNKEKLSEYQEMQRRGVRRLLRNLHADPAKFLDHFHLYFGGTMLEITYGQQITSLDDELVQMADRGINTLNAGGQPTALVDFFPILQHIPNWMPGAGFKRHAKVIHSYLRVWKDWGHDALLRGMDAGTVAPCMLTDVFSQYGRAPTPSQAEEMKALAITVYGGGVETSRGTLSTFLLAMVHNPDVLRKAQEEIDLDIGDERLPNFDDRDSLPYLNALLEEVYRWNPTLPLAIPHRTRHAQHYAGYDIPADSTLIANTWAMTRDTRYYPDPESFRPERYLKAKSSSETGRALIPSNFVFGFGRRVCPGQALADNSLWLAIANIVALFDIGKARDATGKEIIPPLEFVSAFTNFPAPFVCDILPRSGKTASMLTHLEV
ncbi:cytochrome P450 [Trametes maxima]|nr:cytochrome P450 [Trametes maxima]